jgi:beta-1,4-mannosyl-glycoprotein beta-1,4-N-acetylglucosaminyltransferase
MVNGLNIEEILTLKNCEDNDIIIFSDLDEIPNPDKLNTDGHSYYMHQKNMIYYLNKENVTENWFGTVIVKFGDIKNKALTQVRIERSTYVPIYDGGWHLTFMGGEHRISEKIKSYGHQEYNTDFIHSQISNKLSKNQDVLGRSLTIKNINIVDYYPENVIKMIKQKFNYLLSE